jgi:hypothetical protein
LWVCKIGNASPQVFKLSEARYLAVKEGKNDFFSVVHHHDGDKLEISAHHHAEPHRSISSIHIERSGGPDSKTESNVTGDASVWAELPRAYVASEFGDFQLVLVHLDASVSTQSFPWYSDTNYDKIYQGITDVQEVSNTGFLIVSIQRNSNPVLYDPENKTVVRKLKLADRGGRPHFKLRASAGEFWADDYDHIVKLNSTNLDVVAIKQLQEPGNEMTRQFIGDFLLCRAETICLVARPFSGDVLALECDTMRPVYRSLLGKQPLEAALLGDKVVAIDWKTGEFLSGLLVNA